MSASSPCPATETSQAVRDFAARLCVELEAFGLKRDQFREAASTARYTVSKATLNRHIAAVLSCKSAFTTDSMAGAAPLLDEEKREIMAGWVLEKTL